VALELHVREGDGPVRTQVIAKDVAFFGRREDNDVVLPFTFVSSRHGRIFRRNGAVFVEDMGSTNGTNVDGRPLTPMVPRPLSPEEGIEIEKVVMQARWVEERAKTEAPATYHEAAPGFAASATAQASPPEARPAPPATDATVVLRPRVATPAAPLPAVGSAPPLDPPPEASSTVLEMQRAFPDPAPPAVGDGAARLGHSSLPDVLATGRMLQKLRADENDRYVVYEMIFKAIGLAAILAGIAMMVFVLIA
jgi:predicted component of type VI protein secretion system